MEIKKKVLIFIPEFPVLTETFIQREVVKLAQSPKLDVVVLSLKKTQATLDTVLKDKVEYKRLDWSTVLHTLPFLIKHLSLFAEAFKCVIRNSNRNVLQTIYLLLKSVSYAYIFSTYQPEIIYAHFMSESSTIGLIASILLKTEFAISAHAKDVLQEKGPVAENVELVSEKLKRAKFVSVCNKNAYNRVVKLSKVIEPKNMHLIFHGIDEKDLTAKLKNTAEIEGLEEIPVPVILTIGRFVEKKGFQYLVEASGLLRDLDITHKVFIIGAAGPLYEGIKDQIKVLDLEDNIEILGGGKGLSFEEVLKYYKIADVFVLPSINTELNDADGIPNVLVEAAFLNIPIVTTDAGSILDFIENKKTGLVVAQRNSKQLAEAIESVLKNKQLSKILVKNAHEKVREMFDIEKNVREIVNLLLS